MVELPNRPTEVILMITVRTTGLTTLAMNINIYLRNKKMVIQLGDIREAAERKCYCAIPENYLNDKDKVIQWMEDNWLDFVEEKHKWLFGE